MSDTNAIILQIEGAAITAIYATHPDIIVYVVEAGQKGDPDQVMQPPVTDTIDSLPMDSWLMQAIDKAAECPNQEEHRHEPEGDPDAAGHGICPRCKVRPLSCDEDGEPWMICEHCDWEDKEPA